MFSTFIVIPVQGIIRRAVWSTAYRFGNRVPVTSCFRGDGEKREGC